MGGRAESGAVRGRMHVRNVRADGEMDGDGDSVLVGCDENARGGMFEIELARGEEFSGGFAISDARIGSSGGNFVEVSSCFACHPEFACAKAGFDVLGSVTAKRDFKIVDERGAVHGNAGDKSPANEVVENGTEAGLDHVAADAPKNGLAGAFCCVDGDEEIAKIIDGEDPGERVEKRFQ